MSRAGLVERSGRTFPAGEGARGLWGVKRGAGRAGPGGERGGTGRGPKCRALTAAPRDLCFISGSPFRFPKGI